GASACADDIEIGAGATLLSMMDRGIHLQVHWCVLSGAGDREKEARASAADFLSQAVSAQVEVTTGSSNRRRGLPSLYRFFDANRFFSQAGSVRFCAQHRPVFCRRRFCLGLPSVTVHDWQRNRRVVERHCIDGFNARLLILGAALLSARSSV